MMNKHKTKKKKLEFNSEKEYISYYNTLSVTYKSIYLNKWNILFSEILKNDPENSLSKNMYEFCKKEQEVLSNEKQKQIQKMDEQINIIHHLHLDKKKRK